MPQLNTKFVTLTPEAHLKLSILKAELGERTFSDVIILATDYYRANSYRCKLDPLETPTELVEEQVEPDDTMRKVVQVD